MALAEMVRVWPVKSAEAGKAGPHGAGKAWVKRQRPSMPGSALFAATGPQQQAAANSVAQIARLGLVGVCWSIAIILPPSCRKNDVVSVRMQRFNPISKSVFFVSIVEGLAFVRW
jgi:hypothetical protein